MDGAAFPGRSDRHPGDTYEDILNRDSRPVPDYLREGRLPDVGVEPVAASRYTDPAFFAKEVKYLWSKVWQLACREEDIPNVGDYHIYENVGKSLIVTRAAPGEIKAFYNSCLHRGRQLVTLPGCKQEFRCPYHGIAWNNDGTFKDNPIGWDFPQWEHADINLPQAKVDTWGGYVFVNFDLNAPPVMDQIRPLAEHFVEYDYANRYKAAHVAKVVRCNWKALAEAFMESHHTITTHPQILPFLADVNSQYDMFNDFVTRQFSAQGVPSPVVYDKNYTPTQIVNFMSGVATSAQGDRLARGAGGGVGEVPEGLSARTYAAEAARNSLSAEDGWDYSACSDAEMLDALLYNVWPNMSFWAGFSPNLVYRWRPNGLDPESGIMDVIIMRRAPRNGPRPKPCVVHELGADDPWTDAPELGDG